jgi:hypothetical protein
VPWTPSGHTFNDEHDGHGDNVDGSSVEFQLSCREILSKVVSEDVPEISSRFGERCRSQASATWAVVAVVSQ